MAEVLQNGDLCNLEGKGSTCRRVKLQVQPLLSS